jgi:hypothetical protein
VATFKIRDLMVAIRPGLPTPQRPVELEDCDPDLGSIVCFAAPQTGGGGCDGDSGDCGDTCGLNSCFGSCGACTVTCGFTCGCTKTCGPTCGCTDGCTNTCGGTCGNTNCTQVTCGRCSAQATHCAPQSIAPPIARMGGDELARLKSQLRVVLQQVGQRASVLAAAEERAALVPQTLAQVDALEQKLTEAMDELRARRAQIQKASDQQGTKDKQ